MAGNSKKISDLNAIATMHDTDLVEVSNDNQDSTYTSVKATIGDVAEHVAKTTEFTNDLDTADKTLVGAINEVAGDIPTVNDATLTIQKNSTTIDTFSANASSNVTVDISVPTTVAELSDASDYATTASLASVATSGDYDDLLNKPTIPAAQVNSDWNSGSGVSQILNKPTLAAVATSGSYSDLSGTPTLATVATSGLYSDLSGAPTLATVATSGSYNDLSSKPNIPDGLSDLTDDVNITSPTDGQVLKYDNATSKWVNGTGGGGSSTLDGLTDVNITSATLADGQVLKYDSANSEWVNGTGGGGSNSVELTYAEYQALTPEQQLDGTEYFITDINGDGQQFQPIIYSEEEREIGVWADGKPLYERSFTVTADIQISTNTGSAVAGVTSTYMSDIEPTLDSLVSIVPSRNISNTLTTFYPLSFNLSNGYFRAYDNPDVSYIGYKLFSGAVMTFRYTKTTDQAGSGTWTPQGVPAHHYSNNEQVVGTWVDGKTLYEKTWYFQDNMVSIGTDWTSLNISVSDLNINEIVDHRAQSYNSQSVSIGVWNDSGTLKGIYWQNGLNVGSVTIQYTKSST